MKNDNSDSFTVRYSTMTEQGKKGEEAQSVVEVSCHAFKKKDENFPLFLPIFPFFFPSPDLVYSIYTLQNILCACVCRHAHT